MGRAASSNLREPGTVVRVRVRVRVREPIPPELVPVIPGRVPVNMRELLCLAFTGKPPVRLEVNHLTSNSPDPRKAAPGRRRLYVKFNVHVPF